MNKNCEVIDMSLGGTVVKTAGKAAVAGTKTLAKGTGKAVKGTANAFGNGIFKLVENSKANKTKNDARVKKAESMLSRVVKEVDTTEKSNGMSY